MFLVNNTMRYNNSNHIRISKIQENNHRNGLILCGDIVSK